MRLPLIFYKTAQARWRQPENLRRVAARVVDQSISQVPKPILDNLRRNDPAMRPALRSLVNLRNGGDVDNTRRVLGQLMRLPENSAYLPMQLSRLGGTLNLPGGPLTPTLSHEITRNVLNSMDPLKTKQLILGSGGNTSAPTVQNYMNWLRTRAALTNNPHELASINRVMGQATTS